jgi:hypothetical protein
MPGCRNLARPDRQKGPRIFEEGASVTITEEEPSYERISAAFGGVPRYELRLGKQRPFALTIVTGARDFDLDLGGVPLSGLMVRQGAGNSCSKSARGGHRCSPRSSTPGCFPSS